MLRAARGARSVQVYVRCTGHGQNGQGQVLLARGENLFSSRTLFTGGRSSGSRHNGKGGLQKEFMDYMKRRLVIFRGDMIRKRPFSVPGPLQRFLSSQRNTPYTFKNGETVAEKFTMSYSEVMGHTAFLFSLCMFLETDIFNLRLFAIGSILSSVVFQYYREVPLLIPIRWNVLFVCINIGMLGLLLREYHEAEYMPKEQQELYLKYMAAEGMDKVDFMHLMSKADRKVVKPGEYLIRQGKMNYRVYYVAEGDVKILRDEDVVSKLGANTFVAEMGFVKWRDFEAQRQRKEEKEKEEQRRNESLMGLQSVGTELQRSLSYMGGTLSTPGMEEPLEEPNKPKTITTAATTATTSNVAAVISGTTAVANTRTWSQWFRGVDAAGNYPGTARSSDLKEGLVTDKDGCVVDPATGYRIDLQNHGIVASADVKAAKKCVVYSWRFDDLAELMNYRTGAALVLERSFSNDLSRKMRKHDIKQKYKFVLLGVTLSCTEVKDGQALDPAIAKTVRRLRKEYGVSQRIHREVCDDLKLPLNVFDLPGDIEEDYDDDDNAEDETKNGTSHKGVIEKGESKQKEEKPALLATTTAAITTKSHHSRAAGEEKGGPFTSLAQGRAEQQDDDDEEKAEVVIGDGRSEKGEERRRVTKQENENKTAAAQ